MHEINRFSVAAASAQAQSRARSFARGVRVIAVFSFGVAASLFASIVHADELPPKGADLFTDSVELFIAPGPNASAINPDPTTNFPVKVSLDPAAVPGFDYSRCVKGNELSLRFYAVDDVTPLPYEVIKLDTTGTSEFWVRLPEVWKTGECVRVYWHLKPEAEAPVNDPSAVWSQWSQDQAVSLAGYCGERVFDLVVRDGRIVTYFVTPPSVTPSSWYSTSAPSERGVMAPGVTADGAAVNTFYRDVYTGERFTEMPTDVVSVYEVISEVTDLTRYQPLASTNEFQILDYNPHTDIGGGEGVSGRVLLFNNDSNAAGAINYQGYVDTFLIRPTWWTNLSEEVSFSSSLYPALKAGTEFELRTAGRNGEVLWKLTDCRMGNTYLTRELSTAMLSWQNYLAWSDTSYDINSTGRGPRDLVGSNPLKSGICVMRNQAGASIISKVFTNGVGTVYFDAVNQVARDARGEATEFRDAYTLVVEVTTNEVDWMAVPVTALRRDYPASWPSERPLRRVQQGLPNGQVVLDVVNGGSNGNFYRVYAEVKSYVPTRVRIRRLRADFAYSLEAEDGGFILLDNIIVSPPALDAHLSPAVWSSPFPAVGETVIAKAAFNCHTNAFDPTVEPASRVSSATMHYRWRYLDQKAEPAFGEPWKTVRLNPRDDFKALETIALPAVPGDIEFYYSGNIASDFYSYVDYSGLNLGVPEHSEDVADFVDGMPDLTGDATNKVHAIFTPVRLREGKSEYEAIDLLYRFNGGAVGTCAMTVTDDRAWRGFIPTLTNSHGRLEYRLVARNHQTVGEYTWQTNTTFWVDVLATNTIPVSGTLFETAGEQWCTISNDHATGFLMVQIDDRSKGLTVVHADYQNFNGWNDAKGDYFVGRSDSDGKPKSGVAPTQKTYVETYDDWLDMPATNTLGAWLCTMPDKLQRDTPNWPTYTVFNSAVYNEWLIGRGMWISSRYRQPGGTGGVGAALQMEGRGVGYVEYSHAPYPRGLDKLEFDARIGQAVEFDSFCYYDAGARERKGMTNYAFVARIAYDEQNNRAFSGNASISLVAHYQPSRGCYEARLETVSDPTDAKAKTCLELALYKWLSDSTGRLTAQKLWSQTNGIGRVRGISSATNRLSQAFSTLFISTKTEDDLVEVRLGVCTNGVLATKAGDDELTKGMKFFDYRYQDKSDTRLAYGTYGLETANCEGRVVRPICFDVAVTNAYGGSASAGKLETVSFAGKKTISGLEFDETPSVDTWDYWVYEYGRHEPFAEEENSKYWGMRAAEGLTQTINVYTRLVAASGSESGWQLLTNVTVSGFGTADNSDRRVIPLYTTEDTQVRLCAGGQASDIRTDVVIDEVELTQWRGDDWANASSYVPHGWNVRGYTNFTFSAAWIRDDAMLLSAKRTDLAKPSAIKSPLFDGTGYTTGALGLGRFHFTFTNAQANAELVLQIATNGVDYTTSSAMLDTYDESIWTTVTNFTFTAGERGDRIVYLGLHGVQGMFRLAVPSNVVAAVASERDPSRFGEITITDVSCSDEPRLDRTAWWGWNLRTVGQDINGRDRDTNPYYDAPGEPAGRTYLYDDGVRGLSMALNNAVWNPKAQVSLDGQTLAEAEPALEEFKTHLPFLQSPTFEREIVGEVAFKARKFKSSDADCVIHLYGARAGKAMDTDDTTWDHLAEWTITADTYARVEPWKASPNCNYTAFRLMVTGVDGCDWTGGTHATENPSRVLVDEVIVCEAVRPTMAFRNVGAFRSKTSGTEQVPNVPSLAEQPLCNEGWGVQCEVYASQLSEEIDYEMTPPEVYLSYYKGREPWGYENWGSKIPASQRLRLRMASDTTNLVFRSSHQGSVDSCIPLSLEAETVQYMLEVVYRLKEDPLTPITNRLTKGTWSVPSWYRPLDFNNDSFYGNGKTFAAFNVLDTVAPGWAWINEVNVMGAYDKNYYNTERLKQWIEIAAPAWASLKGWQLQLIYGGSAIVYTNIPINVFGDGDLAATKTSPVCSNMVFHVIAGPKAEAVHALDRSKGEIDGTWSFARVTQHFTKDGEIEVIEPTAVRLIRASGIIEHEIVFAGTNVWHSKDWTPAYVANSLNTKMPNSNFLPVGWDDGGEGLTLGVLTSNGSSTNDWFAHLEPTPGKVNKGQIINSDDMPTPNGEELLIYAYLDSSLPHIRQSFGDMEPTNTTLTLAIRKGTVNGTNIVYTVDPWYTIGEVTCQTGRYTQTLSPVASTSRTWTYQIGAGMSNNVTLNASAAISPALIEAGLDPDDMYTPAVMAWLNAHKDLDGNDWANPEAEAVSLAKLVSLNGNVVTNLSLKEMYWLDIDPTKGNMFLKTGFTSYALTNRLDGVGVERTNRIFGVYMCISNDASPYAYHAPKGLRGLVPGSHSMGYSRTSGQPWTNETFKITGVIQNGRTDLRPHSDNYIPLRWFVFNPDSFQPLGSEKECQTVIEIVDPHSPESAGANAGWHLYPELPILNAFSIDERLVPTGVEPLKKVNYL